MRKITAISIVIIALCQLFGMFGYSAQIQEKIDWPQFLARQDIVWEKLPVAWKEGAFIGNGLTGAMIYSEKPGVLQWDVGRSDVADSGSRLQIGRFELAPSNGIQRGTMRLDLWNAEACGELTTGSEDIKWRSFTHSENSVTFIELWNAPNAPVSFVHLPAIQARAEFKKTPVAEKDMNPDPSFGETDSVQWCMQTFKAGGGYCVAWAEKEIAPGHRLFVWTVDFALTGAPTSTKAVADIQAVLTVGVADQGKSHRDWWHSYWQRGAFLSIPDARMESFYWIQMYKLASGTRADRPALDLMGPWFYRTPWAKIWWNLNVQLTYWPVYAANRLELGESLTRMLDSNIQNLMNNVPEKWRRDSVTIFGSASYDCCGALKGKAGEENGNLIWGVHNYWLQCRYSGDEVMMRERFYPLLKLCIGYYFHLLTPSEDGKFHIPVSRSPEYPKNAPDTNYDLALLRWGLQTVIACNERFKMDDPFAARCRETLEKLAEPPVDPNDGYLIGAGQPLEVSHRHWSHLFAFYPLHLIDSETAGADRELAKKSFDHWLSMDQGFESFSYTGASTMAAWLGRKEDSVKFLRKDVDNEKYTSMNTMYLYTPDGSPCIESPLAAAACLHEIILQSWTVEPFGTRIRVFPSVPDAWKDVTFHQMLAEGAFEVSAVRQNGKTRFVQIKSLAGNPCIAVTGLDKPVQAGGSRKFDIETSIDKTGKTVTMIDLKKGETVLLIEEKTTVQDDVFVIEPVELADRLNFYGSKK